MHASESVLVVSELLCTGVQANTERHTKERNARNVLMLGIQTERSIEVIGREAKHSTWSQSASDNFARGQCWKWSVDLGAQDDCVGFNSLREWCVELAGIGLQLKFLTMDGHPKTAM